MPRQYLRLFCYLPPHRFHFPPIRLHYLAAGWERDQYLELLAYGEEESRPPAGGGRAGRETSCRAGELVDGSGGELTEVPERSDNVSPPKLPTTSQYR